jgi:ribose transport system substrate-binding protein
MKLFKIATAVIGAVCLVGTAGGCASSTSSATTQATAAAATKSDIAGAQKAARAAEEIPTKIGATTPLPHAPKPGVRIALVTCNAPSCTNEAPGFTAAAKALGWEATVIIYPLSQSPAAEVQQAIDNGYKYIAMTSVILSSITSQVQQAKAQGIKLFEEYGSDPAEGATNGLYGEMIDPAGVKAVGTPLGDWVASDSGGHANLLFIDLPTSPSTVTQGQAVQAELLKRCPACTFTFLPVTASQLGAGQAPAAVVTYVRAHPDINYVDLSFNDLDTGMVSAMKSAGLADKVKVFGNDANAVQLQEVSSGAEPMWQIDAVGYIQWAVVDWMARASEGVLTPAALAATASGLNYIAATPAAANKQLAAGNWDGPANYQEQFKALWHVGS